MPPPPAHLAEPVPAPPFRPLAFLAALALAGTGLLAGCATDEGARAPAEEAQPAVPAFPVPPPRTPPRPPPPPRPVDPKARLAGLVPSYVADRRGWAEDIHDAFVALGIPPTLPNLCAVVAITEQESSFVADPTVPGLGRIAREEVARRAERYGIPAFALDAALGLKSSDGRTYLQRIEAARTEQELSAVYEDFIARVPLGQRFLAGYNPVRTGGPMQVGIAFAERHAAERGYARAGNGPIRHEVFTRRGGLHFGIAHLLDYPAPYDRLLYRFADYNAGRWASRNAAFQHAVAVATGTPLDLDGDLVRPGEEGRRDPGPTELAVRTLAGALRMDAAAIRSGLELGSGPGFEGTALHRRVFELAERRAGQALPRARLPVILLKSPKFTRKLTTEWFANRVDERHRRCLARDRPA